MVQDLLSLEIKRTRAALLNDSSMNMGQLAWPGYSHEGYEVLPKTLDTCVSALHYRHNLKCWGFFHIQKNMSPWISVFLLLCVNVKFLYVTNGTINETAMVLKEKYKFYSRVTLL